MTTRRTPRTILGSLAAGVLMATGLTVATSAPAEAAERWSGYSIPKTTGAAGGWIGAYKTGSQRIYYLEPAARTNTSGFITGIKRVGNYRAKAKPSTRSTARAAWIVSKYGDYRLRVQAAAVDASVQHLLSGGPWLLGGPRGAKRIRQSGNGREVVKFARIMLAQSARQAGRYKVQLRAPSTEVGGVVNAVAKVTSGRGRAAVGFPVRFKYGERTAQAITTNSGVATVRFPAGAAGTQRLSATALKLPEWRLHVRKARKATETSVAVAGRRARVAASTQVPIKGTQTLEVSTGAATVTVRDRVNSVFAVNGQGGARTATVQLHGPFGSASSSSCATGAFFTARITVDADGVYRVPGPLPRGAGYYKWSVTVGENELNQSVSGCGGLTTVKAIPAVTSTRTKAVITKGETSATSVRVTGLPNTQPVTATALLYGPFPSKEQVRCTDGKLVRRISLTFNGDDTKTTSPVELNQPGWWVWAASLRAGPLSTAADSVCGGAGYVEVVG
ncbi:MAG: hypothetical protein WKF79_01585 [Nocardioides sp.]